MAIELICGFDCASTLDKWTVSGAATIGTTIVRTGPRSGHIANAGASAYFQHFFNAASVTSVGRFYFYWESLPTTAATDWNILLGIVSAGTQPKITVTSTGVVKFGYTSLVTHGTTVTTGQWYLMDYRILNNDGTGTKKMDFRINKVTATQATLTEAGSNVTAIRIGAPGVTATTTVNIDDVILADDTALYPFGEGQVTAVIVNGDGTHSYTAGDFGDNAGVVLSSSTILNQRVSKSPMTAAGAAISATFLEQIVTRATGYLEFTFPLSQIVGTINGVGVTAAVQAETAAAGTSFLRVNDNGTVETGTTWGSSSVSVVTIRHSYKQFGLRPSSSTIWTPASMSTLRIRWGFSDDAAPDVRLEALMLEIDRNPNVWAPAQAQADIKVTSRGFAQAQTDIKATSFGFAQARAYIFKGGYGQAQAWIKQTYPNANNAVQQTKFYLHDVTTTNTGTLPSAQVGTVTVLSTATGANINRVLNGTIGVLQASSPASLADSSTAAFARRFVSSPLGAQMFYGASNWSALVSAAMSQSDAAATGTLYTYITIWRPSTGLEIKGTSGNPFFLRLAFITTAGATEKAGSGSIATNLLFGGESLTTQVGDILVLETYLYSNTGGVSANTQFFYDGTTEASAVSNAAFIEFDNGGIYVLNGTVNGPTFAQAQASIKVTSNGFAQAQADIKAVGRGFAQAQADIKAVGFGFGQAQADIKAVGFGFGQAQANIKQTYNAFAQAQANIKATNNGFGQAQADIKAVSFGFAQAQADIKAIGYGFSQAQASIKATSNGFGQAQTDIKAVSFGFAQAQADIVQTYFGFAQAQATIKATNNGYGQAQATIKAVGYGFGQAQADIKAISYGFGQAQGYVYRTERGYAQATALIDGAHILFDSFNRDAQVEWGTADSGTDWSTSPDAFTDGEHGALATDSAEPTGVNQYQVTFDDLEAEIKFRLPNSPTDKMIFAWNGQDGEGGSAQDSILILTSQAVEGGTADIVFGEGATQLWTDTDVILWDTESFFILQIQSYHTDATNKTLAYRIFKDGDLAPAWTIHNDVTVANRWGWITLASTNTSSGFPDQYDYINIQEYAPKAYAQAQAYIVIAAAYGFGQAQADILVTEQGYGQAQALIVTTNNAFGQAQATILLLRNGFGQAQADILATSNGYGQAQAHILATGQGYGQAQARIGTVNSGYGQAQGTILATSNAFGQAQADIKSTSNAYGQAQADIKITSQGYAQAQANISAAGYAFGQAQATIKAVGQGYGQSQADIRATSNAYAQAQAYIKITGYGSGQANAKIILRQQGYAQAQATILATVSGLGQAQAGIRTTYNGLGQAQAQITTLTSGVGQAQAYIRHITPVYGQAQADIKAVTNMFGQAQGSILATATSHGNAQADIKTTVIVIGQAEATILATYRGYAQANAAILTTYTASANAMALIVVRDISAFGQAQAFILKAAGYGQAQAFIFQRHVLKNLTVSDSRLVTSMISDEFDTEITLTDTSVKVFVSDIKAVTLTLSDEADDNLMLSDIQH